MSRQNTIELAAVGDVMLGDSSHFLGRGVGSHIRRHGAAYPFAGVRDRLADKDLLLANLESPLSATEGSCSWERVYRGATSSAEALRLARRNIVTLANNHILEHGPGPLAETKRALAAAGLDYVGFDAAGDRTEGVLTFRQGGLSLQVIADSLIADRTRRPMDAAERERWLLRTVEESVAVIRIVSLHWGHEYVRTPSPEQRRLGRALIDAGACLVLGHHPHVLQPVEEYGAGLIAYSLGNFLFDQDWTDHTRLGGILCVTVGADGVHAWRFLPTFCDSGCRPRVAPADLGETALATIGDEARLAPGAYRAARQRAQRHHRLMMKVELLRNIVRVGGDTWHFLVTKRRRAPVELPIQVGRDD